MKVLTMCFLLIVITTWTARAQTAVEMDSSIVDDPGFRELRIDPGYTVDVPAGDIFDSIRYVFLETTKESEFSNISQLEVTKKHYIIFDHRLQTILFFFKDGRFDRKLSAPKDFERAKSFAVREADSTLIIDDLYSFYQYVFGVDGSFRKKEPKISTVNDIAYIDSFKIQYNGFSVTTTVEGAIPESYPNLVVRNEKNQSEKAYLWFNPQKRLEDDIYSGRTFYRSGTGGIFFARELDNFIYRFNRDGSLKRQFKLILPMENSLPSDFLTSPVYDNKRIEFLKQSRLISHAIGDVYQLGEWLTFRFFPERPFLYNLTTGEYIDVTQLDFDCLGVKTRGANAILGVDGKAFIASQPTVLLKHLYGNLSSNEKSALDPALKKAVSRPYHNPVLQLLSVKQ